MYSVCRTTHPSTQVTNSLYCHFYTNTERNLVTTGGNQLKVYRLIRDVTKQRQKEVKFDIDELDPQCVNVKLECLQTFKFNGHIESMDSVSFVGSSRDSLVVAFADAKVSIVEYDPEVHDLKTISMHYFEDDEMRRGCVNYVRPPEVRVDPENRCAAIMIYNKKIIVIPFRKDIVVEEENFEGKKNFFSATTANRKSPVLPSYELRLDHSTYNVNITNIVDIQFLHNYYNPTLLILYEPIRTWAGRVAIRQDTVSMMTLSLDVNQHNHPQIWSLNNLPFNTFGALPVPKPIGGVLIFAPNAVIHLSQGHPPYGISLNNFNEANTSFPLKTYAGAPLNLACSKGTFVSSSKILLSLENGEIFILHLHNDRARSVRTFNFTLLAASITSSSITKCEEGYIFLGSKVAHSILLFYKEKESAKDQNLACTRDQSATKMIDLRELSKIDLQKQSEDEYLYGEEYCRNLKKIRVSVDEETELDTSQSFHNGSIPVSDDEDENETEEAKIERRLFGKRKPVQMSISSVDARSNLFKLPSEVDPNYLLRHCDTLENIAPCGYVTFGEPSMVHADELTNFQDVDVEIMTTSGFKKSGALTVLQRSIKPRIETSFELEDSLDVWTLKGRNTGRTGHKSQHEFMLISQHDSTIVFQIGQEINEVEESGFNTESATVCTGNLGDNRYILQVCADSVTLLEGTIELQRVPMKLGSPIVRASIADPYTVLLTENGKIMILSLKTDGKKGPAKLTATLPKIDPEASPVVAFSVYRDVSGLFSIQGKKTEKEIKCKVTKKSKTKTTTETASVPNFASANTAAEEEELLYGDSLVYYLRKTEQDDDEMETEEEKSEVHIPIITAKESTFWLFVARQNGQLEVHRLPDFVCVYKVKNFACGPRVLVDTECTHETLPEVPEEDIPVVRELLVVGMGVNWSRPMLFGRFDQELIVYELFPFDAIEADNRLRVRFRRLQTPNVFVRYPEIVESLAEAKLPKNNQWLRTFANICGYSGVFLCGPFPAWFLMTSRGELRIHAMEMDGPVTSFAPLNSSSCKNGFLYFNAQEDLRICRLSNYFNLDGQWPFKQIPVGDTINFVAYHVETKVYAIVRTRMVKMTQIVRIGGEEKDYDPIDATAGYIHCQQEQYDLVLVSPTYWEVIPGSITELEEGETVTALKIVYLTSEGTSTGLKGYIAMATCYSYGEDVTSRGRIHIMDVIEVVPEPGQPMTKNKLKVVYAKEQKGPVTALCDVKGYLFSAIGQKVYMWQLKENDLIGIAFIDTQIYAIETVAIRSLILVADVYKSLYLLHYEEETRTLALVSRDQRPLQVYSCEYLIDGADMNFVVSDSEKNLIVYTFQPELAESLGGTRLLRRADFHLGSHVNSFFRIRCNVPFIKSAEMAKQRSQFSQRHITMFSTLDGQFGYLMPVSENIYRRLLMLQNLLTSCIPHAAGLNPRSYRKIKFAQNELQNSHKNILDGDLIFQYLSLPLNERLEIAKKIGTQEENLLNNLQEIRCLTAHF